MFHYATETKFFPSSRENRHFVVAMSLRKKARFRALKLPKFFQ